MPLLRFAHSVNDSGELAITVGAGQSQISHRMGWISDQVTSLRIERTDAQWPCRIRLHQDHDQSGCWCDYELTDHFMFGSVRPLTAESTPRLASLARLTALWHQRRTAAMLGRPPALMLCGSSLAANAVADGTL